MNFPLEQPVSVQLPPTDPTDHQAGRDTKRVHRRRRPWLSRWSTLCQVAAITLAATTMLGDGSWRSSPTTTSAFCPPRISSVSFSSKRGKPSHPSTGHQHDNSNSNSNRGMTSLKMVETLASRGLSRYFQSILSRSTNKDRQRFVTGQYPIIVSVQENPTQKWLHKDSATSLLLVNDTTLDRSLASYDRFQWLDDVERRSLHDRYASVSIELLAEIHMSKPGYVQILSSEGAGSSAEATREFGSTSGSNRWQNSTLYQELIVDELLERRGRLGVQGLLPRQDRLWVTGFSLAGRKGFVKSLDVRTGYIESVNARSESMTLWPNEVTAVPKALTAAVPEGNPDSSSSSTSTSTAAKKRSLFPYDYEDALLVSDGFLVPGKDRGGIYVIHNPGNPYSEWTVPLTDLEGENWFYHRAVWVDLTGDGRKSILTARAKFQKVAGRTGNTEERRPKNGQLVWLEMPEPHHYDKGTGTPLEENGTEFDPFSARHLPWKERLLARGPDVMFSVADLDTSDDTIEVIASQFFDKKVTLHSIQRGPKPRISFTRVIDDRCGSAFGGILADLGSADGRDSTVTSHRQLIDSGSTVDSVKPGDSFTHVLITSHECNYADKANDQIGIDITDSREEIGHHHQHHRHHRQSTMYGNGQAEQLDAGSLFAYKVPEGRGGWKTQPWTRTTVATGFKVKGQFWNVINPGAPGFVYTFHAKQEDIRTGKRPMIAVAGDCAESAYIFRPEKAAAPLHHLSKMTQQQKDPDAQYNLMCEIKCGATVGSIGVGYDNLCSVEQESGYAKLYIPCYEKDKILVFALGSGDDDKDDDGWYESKSHLV